MIDAFVLYIFRDLDTSLVDLDINSIPQECQKAMTFALIIPQSFQSVWMEFGLL